MDNDIKLIKAIKKVVKKIRFSVQYINVKIYSETQGNDLIYNLIKKGNPAAVVRLGAVEAKCVYPWIVKKSPSTDTLQRGLYCAGIFPNDIEYNAEFSKIYLESAKNCDVMALWDVFKEKKIIKTYCSNAKFIKAKSIEPYYFPNPWTKALKNKKVLIISPFIETIKKQYKIREKIFVNQDILPEFQSISFIKAIQSAAGAKCDFECWKDAYEYMCKEIDKTDFDIAIIGAGAYALPLSVYVKKIGKIAIQTSGATQILFGIKGKRWDEHPVISNLYNEYWVRPSIEETPPQTNKVEGGSYW